MVKKTVEEIAHMRPEPPFVEMSEADDITGGGIRFVLVARDNTLWLRGIRHRTEEPILDEPRCTLVTEVGTAPRIHRGDRESALAAKATAVATG
jgi:hypothetical protein